MEAWKVESLEERAEEDNAETLRSPRFAERVEESFQNGKKGHPPVVTERVRKNMKTQEIEARRCGKECANDRN